MGVNNLLVWTAAQYALAEGLHQFHLGGGNDPDDRLFRFKRTSGVAGWSMALLGRSSTTIATRPRSVSGP